MWFVAVSLKKAPQFISSPHPERGFETTFMEQRSRFRFSLYTLFVVVTVACAFFAYPRYLAGVIALLFGVLVAGVLFVVLVLIPVQKIAALFAKGSNQSRNDTESSPIDR